MSNQSVGVRVLDQLVRAIDSDRLPETAQERAKHLLARIEKPVRLALMGLPGSGKSSVMNLLVGSEVVTPDGGLPSMQLTYGPEPVAVCTLPDGTKSTQVAVDSYSLAASSPIFIDLEMPLPALRKISVLEVVAPNDPNAIHRAVQWASKRCDVALWCTQGFNELEQRIWSQVPDIVKDHAFLMVTKADFLEANGLLDKTVGMIQSVAGDEFNKILPIATKDALSARKRDGSVNKIKLKTSGGTALISAVLRHVEAARQVAVDMADVLLHQNIDVLGDIMTNPVAEAPAEPASKPEPEPVKEDAAEPAAEKVEEPPAEEDTPEPAAPEIATAPTGGLKPASREAYQEAVTYLIREGQNMAQLVEEEGDAAPAKIMAKTVEHVQWVSDYLNDHGDETDLRLQEARNAAMDAADLVQLMQMEKQDSATIEALAVLVQLKHEMQADLAA